MCVVTGDEIIKMGSGTQLSKVLEADDKNDGTFIEDNDKSDATSSTSPNNVSELLES